MTREILKSVAIIGGGIAGMSSALSLANRGSKVTLIEKDEKLGGMLNNVYRLYPRETDAVELLTTISIGLNLASALGFVK